MWVIPLLACMAMTPRSEAPGDAAVLVPVKLSVRGTHARTHAAAIAQRLSTSYHVLTEADTVAGLQPLLFIDVDAQADAIVVEVRDGEGVISRQSISMLEDERDVLVWLVVRSALDRAASPATADVAPVPPSLVESPTMETPPTIVAAPPVDRELAAWKNATLSLRATASVVGAAAEDLVPEPGVRVAFALEYGVLAAALDAGYRRQHVGPLSLDAVPVALTLGAAVYVEGGARVDIGVRTEVAPKWLDGKDATVELSAGPAVELALPFAQAPQGAAGFQLELTLGAAAMGKLYRQGFLLDDGVVVTESPVRAHVSVGVGGRWGG